MPDRSLTITSISTLSHRTLRRVTLSLLNTIYLWFLVEVGDIKPLTYL